MKKLLAAALAGLVVVALAAFVILNAPPAEVFPKAQVGIFFYVWYSAVVTDWQHPKFIDYPVWDLGNYSSLNKTVLRRQLVLMEELGVDFVVISWWGFHDTYQQFIDNATRQVFEGARSLNTNLKFAIMVEPFNKTGNSYDYQGIYNHVCDNFMEPYSDLYYNYSGRPLICFFNNESLTDNGFFPEDESSRFTVITVGQKPYTQWIYTNLTNLNETDLASYEPRRQTSVTPRFDNSQNQTKTPSITVDPDLTEGVYDQEWEKALQLAREGKIDIITISSWNEYVERTQIEPHYDGTSNKAPDFLYNKTRDYIKQVNFEKNVQRPGSAGVNDIDHYARRVLAGYPLRKSGRTTGSKEIRANPLSSAAEQGNVRLIKGNWNRDFLDEIELFPHGAQDDIVDASSGAFSKLTEHVHLGGITVPRLFGD